MSNTSGSVSSNQNNTLTMHDPVTGLANKDFLDIRLDFIISDAKENNEPLALVRIKLHHDKPLNDGVYKDLAQILKRQTRLSDFLARFQENEFIVVLTNVDKSLAGEIVARLKASIEESGVKASLGMAMYRVGLHGKELMEEAEQALS